MAFDNVLLGASGADDTVTNVDLSLSTNLTSATPSPFVDASARNYALAASGPGLGAGIATFGGADAPSDGNQHDIGASSFGLRTLCPSAPTFAPLTARVRPMNLNTLSAVRLADMIRRREITSRDAVDSHIALAERVNPTLNAIVRTRFAEARREADAADARTMEGAPAGELPPFHGVPCTIKECFEFTGMPNSAGLVRRRHVIATKDATAVKRLRGAGAIPLGVTNVSELCMWMESTNRVYGRSNNPYDPTADRRRETPVGRARS